jgi:hypothetical protein
MKAAQWRSLPGSVRVAASAFAIHALLLLVDLLFFAAAYAGLRENDHLSPVLRIVAVCLLVWSLVRQASRPWLIGAIAFTAFLIRDLVRLWEIFQGPALESDQRLLTVALLFSLMMGIGASWWSSRLAAA